MGDLAGLQAGNGADLRAGHRTNLMLAATIAADGRFAAVRIRNLSEMGALLEGSGLPEKGTVVLVKRGDLAISATVAWSAGDRCGVRFDRPTAINEWTGGKPAPQEGVRLPVQTRTDDSQAEARRRSAESPRANPGAAGGHSDHLEARLADELAYVQRLLESMGDELVSEPIVVRNHARTLQSIDIASQILGHLASIMIAGDRGAAVEAVGMEELRARLKRKPLA